MKHLASLAFLPLTLCAALAPAAPAPFPKTPATSADRLRADDLVGEWAMRWSDHPWSLTLGRDGSYSSRTGGLRFVGSWGVRDGCLWITESNNPEDDKSWRSYQIRLCPTRRSGKVEFGSPGIEVKLSRLE